MYLLRVWRFLSAAQTQKEFWERSIVVNGLAMCIGGGTNLTDDIGRHDAAVVTVVVIVAVV